MGDNFKGVSPKLDLTKKERESLVPNEEHLWFLGWSGEREIMCMKGVE